MNLQENILRIKEMMGLSESEREIFDFSDLVNKGVLWVTEPHVNGELVPSNWEGDSNIVTLWNLKNPEQGQEWVYDAIKHPKLEAIQYWTNEGQFSLSREKYEQILRSIEMLNRKTEDSLNESKKNKEIQFVKIYSDGGGSDDAAEFEGEVISIPIVDTISNEPFKDTSYMENSDNIKNMVKSINDGNELPPIKVIQHPYSDSKYVVVDGNHRRFAFSKSDKKEIDAVVIPHDNVLLMKNEWGEEPEEYIKLTDVLKNKKVIDKYFVSPDGSNNFKVLDKSEVSEKKESGEKWIKCVNCNKKFTQTIHKGKKSLPICPHCGTNNELVSETQIPSSLRRRLIPSLPRLTSLEFHHLNPSAFNSFDEFFERVVSNVVWEIGVDTKIQDYEENLKVRKKIHPFIEKYIKENLYDEIEEYYFQKR
jgi:hypothetical protein